MTPARAAVVAAALVVAGCDAGPKLKLAPVSGTVTLEGAPLKDGVVVFTKDGEAPREVKVADGAFDGQAFVGRNHLQFAVYRVPPGRAKASGPGAEGQSLENVLPSRYNQESREFRDVTDGPNRFTFELKSK